MSGDELGGLRGRNALSGADLLAEEAAAECGAPATPAPPAPSAAAVSEKPGMGDAFDAFRYRDFTVFWIGGLLSNAGTWVQNLAVPFVVYQLTQSAGMVGFAAFLQLIPMVLFSPLGGSLADRMPRKRVLLISQSALGVEALVLWLVWITGNGSLPAILTIVFIGGAITGLNVASWQAFVTELVPREALRNAITLNSTQFNAARFFGPAVGGIVLAAWGPSWAFFVNAVSYLSVITALLLIRGTYAAPATSRERSGILREFVEAARETKRYPGIRASFIAVTALGLLGGPLNQLVVVFSAQVFHASDFQYGLLSAAMGLGSVLAAPFIAGPGSGWQRSRMLLVSMIGYGAALVLFAATSLYWLAFVALLATSVGWLAIAVTLNTTIQLQVEEAIRGKVLALYVMLLTLAMPVGALIQGQCAQWFGPQVTVVVAGLLFLLVTVWLRLRPDLSEHVDDEGPLFGGDAGVAYPANGSSASSPSSSASPSR